MERCFTMTSFKILLSAWPMWMSPLAYGGPSWRTNLRAPGRAAFLATICSKTLPSSQARRISGSRCGRVPFMGEPGLGGGGVGLRGEASRGEVNGVLVTHGQMEPQGKVSFLAGVRGGGNE